MMSAIWQKNSIRRFSRNAVALLLALAAGLFLNHDQWYWVVIGALLVLPTTRGTPVRQGLVRLILLLFVLIVGSVAMHYLLRADWTIENGQMLQSRLLLVTLGGFITIICQLIILPVMPYQEFRRALITMLDVLIDYSNQASYSLLSGGETENTLIDIAYPEWVFETGFNRNFRGSFRYVLIQMDRVIEAFFSLDYYLHEPLDADVRRDIARQLATVIQKNGDLLRITRAFFANESSTKINENFISDITDLNNILQAVLPDSLELLDVSPDYTIVSAAARDVMDVRELLLQILTGLPVDELAVIPQ